MQLDHRRSRDAMLLVASKVSEADTQRVERGFGPSYETTSEHTCFLSDRRVSRIFPPVVGAPKRRRPLVTSL